MNAMNDQDRWWERPPLTWTIEQSILYISLCDNDYRKRIGLPPVDPCPYDSEEVFRAIKEYQVMKESFGPMGDKFLVKRLPIKLPKKDFDQG